MLNKYLILYTYSDLQGYVNHNLLFNHYKCAFVYADSLLQAHNDFSKYVYGAPTILSTILLPEDYDFYFGLK